MAKLKGDKITQQDLLAHVSGDDDFPFEMKVVETLSTGLSGQVLDISHGGTYTDPATRKNRQFDIRLTVKLTSRIRLKFAIECKNLRENFPLLVYQVKRKSEESFIEVVAESHRPSAEQTNSSVHRIGGWFYPAGDLVAKDCTQVGKSASNGNPITSDQSGVYDKWSQAVNSSFDLIQTSFEQSYYAEKEDVCRCYVIPIVVVPDARLWSQEYTDSGSSVGGPIQISHADYFLDAESHHKYGHGYKGAQKSDTFTLSHVAFVTLGGLTDVLAKYFNIAQRNPPLGNETWQLQ